MTNRDAAGKVLMPTPQFALVFLTRYIGRFV